MLGQNGEPGFPVNILFEACQLCQLCHLALADLLQDSHGEVGGSHGVVNHILQLCSFLSAHPRSSFLLFSFLLLFLLLLLLLPVLFSLPARKHIHRYKQIVSEFKLLTFFFSCWIMKNSSLSSSRRPCSIQEDSCLYKTPWQTRSILGEEKRINHF